MARRLRRMDLEAHLTDPTLRQQYVTPLFDVIAPRYDDFTRVFSFGMDRGWKRELLDQVAVVAPHDAAAVDLACGTGDLAFAIGHLRPRASIVGVDASPQMIGAAIERCPAELAPRITLMLGDIASIALPSAMADVITAGYGFRNVPDHRAALREAARVLKPGGHLLTLDFYRPENRVWRALVVRYLAVAGGVVGWLWHRVPVVYAYLGPSVAHFVSWQQFSRDLEATGFAVERVERKLLGAIAIHRARRR
jgi:demethylmenaquinone methyltransferase/2-methoxy-6-polyprenyl-1,4-benzoquinol methylase